jgi:hypothetical protein
MRNLPVIIILFLVGCATGDIHDCPLVLGTSPCNANECEDEGACGILDGECVVNEEGCAASSSCATFGLCHEVGGECVAESAADCEASLVCEQEAWCCVVSAYCDVCKP